MSCVQGTLQVAKTAPQLQLLHTVHTKLKHELQAPGPRTTLGLRRRRREGLLGDDGGSRCREADVKDDTLHLINPSLHLRPPR